MVGFVILWENKIGGWLISAKTGMELLDGCHTLVCSKPLRLVRHEALETRTDVGFGDMDIVSLSNSRGGMAHKLGQSVSVHAALPRPRFRQRCSSIPKTPRPRPRSSTADHPVLPGGRRDHQVSISHYCRLILTIWRSVYRP
jgi:hypothetical protein